MSAVVLASAGSAQSLRGQMQVSPGSSLMALMLCLLLTQGQFQPPVVVGVTSWLLAWLELCCPHGSPQCVLHASLSLSILLRVHVSTPTPLVQSRILSHPSAATLRSLVKFLG